MKFKLAAMALILGGSLMAQTNFSVGIGIGAPPPAPRYYAPPPSPGVGFSWVSGYWYPVGGRYQWRAGYWARPPVRGGYWVAPRYSGGRYFNGYWGGGDRDHDGVPNRYDRHDNRFRNGYRR